jgi:VanZ family protein
MRALANRLLAAAFYLGAGLVGVLSLAPGGALPEVPVDDKAEHALAYAALGLLGAASSHGTARLIVGLAVYGTALELLQAFSPGRSPDPADALADIIGACVGVALGIALRRVVLIAAK